MTCIIGLEHEGKVYMGADSASCRDWDIRTLSTHKVFIRKDMIFGCTGSIRTQQIIQYNFIIPPNPHHGINGDKAYLFNDFIPAMRASLVEGGHTKIENNREETESVFLLGWNGHIYVIHSNFAVEQIALSYMATGAGENYAMGALAAMKIINPEKAIMKALEISGKFCNGVCPPYYVYSI